jgi:ubiquinone/menaquinone biosynthesis C-methylase UbiE
MVHNTITPDIETASDAYRSRFSGPVGAFFLRVQRQSVLRLLDTFSAKKPLKILELGGGHGQITELLLEQGHEVWVQGSSAECFSFLRPLAQKYPQRLHFVESSLWTVPMADGFYDAVIALRLMAHVDQWKGLLAEMSRLSRNGLIVDFPVKSALNALTPLLFGVKKKIEGNTRPYFNYSRSEVEAALHDLKLSRISEIRQFFFPMGLHRALKSAPFSELIEGIAKTVGATRVMGSPILLSGIKQRH